MTFAGVCPTNPTKDITSPMSSPNTNKIPRVKWKRGCPGWEDADQFLEEIKVQGIDKIHGMGKLNIMLLTSISEVDGILDKYIGDPDHA